MAGRYLLDTNIVVALFGGQFSVKEETSKAEEIFLSSVAVGELYYGVFSSRRVAENQSRLEHFVDAVTILACDEVTALHFGQIKNGLRLLGRPIPDNDLWIAALSQQYGLTLVTRDKHFRAIENLAVASW